MKIKPNQTIYKPKIEQSEILVRPTEVKDTTNNLLNKTTSM